MPVPLSVFFKIPLVAAGGGDDPVLPAEGAEKIVCTLLRIPQSDLEFASVRLPPRSNHRPPKGQDPGNALLLINLPALFRRIAF